MVFSGYEQTGKAPFHTVLIHGLVRDSQGRKTVSYTHLEDVAEHPAIMGHEFAGDIVKVGKNHQDQFKPGMKFTLQPALNYKGTMWSPGYSYEFFGGDTTYCRCV